MAAEHQDAEAQRVMGGRPDSGLLVYRAMTAAADGRPLLAPSARGLGVRTSADPLDIGVEQGMVGPSTPARGLSVAPDTPMNLPRHRRPPEWGGTGKDPVWSLDLGKLPDALRYVPDQVAGAGERARHGIIEPATRMPLEEYEEALASTRDLWQRVTKG